MRAVSRFLGAMLLGAVALFAVHVGAVEAGGMCHSTAITRAAGAAVEVRNNCYEPTILEVQAGETVTWTNRDAALHTVTGANLAWGNSDEFGRDETMSFTFEEAGVYPYLCVLHPLMLGAVVVTDRGDASPVLDLAMTAPDAGESEAAPELPAIEPNGNDGVLMALALGGVGLGLVAGLGASADWRRWRLTRP